MSLLLRRSGAAVVQLLRDSACAQPVGHTQPRQSRVCRLQQGTSNLVSQLCNLHSHPWTRPTLPPCALRRVDSFFSSVQNLSTCLDSSHESDAAGATQYLLCVHDGHSLSFLSGWTWFSPTQRSQFQCSCIFCTSTSRIHSTCSFVISSVHKCICTDTSQLQAE